jgi:hypothetical protein
VSPVKYEVGFYIPEDDILHSHRREHLKSYVQFGGVLGVVLSETASRQSSLPVRALK